MDEKLFSVSMCVYYGDNAEQFDAAINSVISQTLPPKEITLVVDGPITEEIEDIIEKYDSILFNSSIFFNLIRLESNMGHGEARRISLENCSCSLVGLMDADDLAVSDRFEKQVDYLSKHPDVSVVGGFITEFVSASIPTDISKKAGRRTVPEDDANIKDYMKKRCPMNQVTVMLRKDDIIEVGGYMDWYCEEDYYLWLRLALSGKKFGNIPETLVNVRVGNEMYQRRGGWKYFKSEAKLQKYMFSNKIIRLPRYLLNISERLILQVLMPNKLRGYIFKKIARN